MPDRHNVLFLMTDQHRTDTLGCYGNDLVDTPGIDGLAADGTRFAQAFTPTAICTPARATLLTGVRPFRHGLLANHERNVGYPEELADDVVPFSRLLRDAGYNVGLEGKWHVGRAKGPAAFGFDGPHFAGWGNPVDHPEFQAYLSERGLPPHRVSEPVRGTFPNGEPGNLLAGILEQPVEATFECYLAERTIQQLERYAKAYRDSGTPFYLACHWFGPHLPYLVPRTYYDRYRAEEVSLPKSIAETFADKPPVQRHYSAHWAFDDLGLAQWRKLIAVYWGYVRLIDEQVSRIIDALHRLELWDSTAVAFTADHGEFTGSHRLHDKGPAMYDDIYRIPCVVRVPDAPKGIIDQHFTELTDLTPTFLELAGITPPDHYDGHSLLGLVRGDRPQQWRQEIVAEFHGHHFPYPQRMIRTPHYKLVVNPESTNELYDLDSDPHELINRYRHPELADVRQELLGRLYRVLRERGDNFYHWMASSFEVGGKTFDTALSQVDR